MSFDPSALDITLLRQRPDEFIIHCQPLIKICVGHYIKTKMFAVQEEEDVIQSVNERLIQRMPVIAKKYNGSSQLNTYMSVVINNICLNLFRDRDKSPQTVQLDEESIRSTDDPSAGLYIQDEVERLRVIFILLYRKRNRFLLCAKYYYRMPVSENDIRRTIPSIQYRDIQQLIGLSEPEKSPETLDEIFTVLARLLTKYEGAAVDHNSLRRWTVRTINEVIGHLNGAPPEYAYTVDSLKLLIDHYCQSEFHS
jgi:RNA polymerase sigma factor (sigma-70 family)